MLGAILIVSRQQKEKQSQERQVELRECKAEPQTELGASEIEESNKLGLILIVSMQNKEKQS